MRRSVSRLHSRLSILLRPRLIVVLLGVVASGCASTPGRTTSYDPWVKMNRGIYKFNDDLDKAVLKPVATGYKKVTPEWLRGMTGRFFENLSYPITIVNQLLQGKPKLFLEDTGRFVTNSTLGLAGLFDVADHMGMHAHDEDFGQTFAVWGVPSGPYLMLPLVGPSSLRDAPAKIPAYFLGPSRLTHVSTVVDLSARALQVIDTRASLLGAESTLKSAFDRYGLVRDAWVQRREYLIFDGSPPEASIEDYYDDSSGDDSSGDDSSGKDASGDGLSDKDSSTNATTDGSASGDATPQDKSNDPPQ